MTRILRRSISKDLMPRTFHYFVASLSILRSKRQFVLIELKFSAIQLIYLRSFCIMLTFLTSEQFHWPYRKIICAINVQSGSLRNSWAYRMKNWSLMDVRWWNFCFQRRIFNYFPPFSSLFSYMISLMSTINHSTLLNCFILKPPSFVHFPMISEQVWDIF